MGSLLEDYKKSQQSGLLDEFKQSKQPEAPVANPAPQVQRIPVANAGPYTSGDEFQALLQQAKQVGVDNLPEPQKSQVKAAIQGGVVREADLMGTQADPKVQDTLSAVGEVAQGFVQSGDPEDVQKYAPGLLESLDQAFSKAMQMPGGEAAGQAMEEMFSTKLAMNGFNLMPDTIPKDNSLAEIGRASENLVKGAVRMLPELLVGFYQNPHEFVKGFITFPVHEVNLLLQASIGWKVEGGAPVEVTADQVKKARQEIVNNPLGIVMLGMMAVGGAKSLKQSEYATVNLKEYQRIAEQAKAGEKVKDVKEPVTMGAEDVGKPVPEAKPVETPEVVNTKAWTDPVDIAAKEAGDAHGIVYNGQFPATKKKPASYTFYDPQANNTNINVFDLNDLPDRVAEVREKFKKAEADKAAEAAKNVTSSNSLAERVEVFNAYISDLASGKAGLLEESDVNRLIADELITYEKTITDLAERGALDVPIPYLTKVKEMAGDFDRTLTSMTKGPSEVSPPTSNVTKVTPVASVQGGGKVDFPESKVTETVYHGSPADNITEFFTEQGKTGGNTGATNTALGAYFSESPEIATTAAFGFSPLGAFSGKPLTLYDVKLNLRKPLDLDALTTAQITELEKSFPGFKSAYKKASSEGEKMSLLRFFAKARDKGPVRENFATFGRRAGLTDAAIEQQFKNRSGKEFSEWDALQKQAMDASINSVGKARLKALGYDGIVLKTISDSGDKLGPKKQYVVFDKENIAITNKRSILDMADESPTPPSPITAPPVASGKGGGVQQRVGEIRPAIRYDGKVYIGKTGENHVYIWEQLPEGFDPNKATDAGWVTQDGTWLNRKQAAQYVLEKKNITKEELSQYGHASGMRRAIDTPPSPITAPPVASVQGGGDFTLGKLNRESYAYKGTGGIASEQQGKIKSAAFRDTETGEVFDTGPIHNLDNLPERAVASRDADGFVIGKSTLESGFVMNDGTFKTRQEVATKPPRQAPSPTPPSPVGKAKELVKPERVATGFKEADIARNLAHTRGFIKSLEERIKEGDKNPETVKTWKRQLQEAKAEEADLMKQVEDVQADNLLGAGLSPDQITSGITNRALREAERRRAASRSEADVSDPAQVEGTIQQPSIRVLHDTKDIGISAGIRTPQGLLGAAPDLPARYGEAAKEAGQTILLTETEIMRESGFRAERLQDALKKADKKDWGKNGDKLYDHIADPSRDGELQPSSLEAVQEVRKFLEEDRQEIIGIKREKLRKSVSTLEEKAYRQANDLVGKKLDDAQIAEVQALAEEALREKVPDDWGVENYLPQFHPGSWEILRDGVHVGTAHTPFDAKLKAIEDYASHPELTPDSYTIQGRAFRGGDVVRVGRPRFRKIVSDIADAAEGAVSKDEVSQFLAGKIGTKEGKQKFAGFLQKRQGFEGFSKDLPRVLGMYNQQFVRWKYLSDMNAKIQPLIDKIKKEERPQTAEYVQGMMDYLWGPPPTKGSLLLDNTIAKIPGIRNHVKPMLLDRSMGFIKRRTVDAFLKFSPRFHGLNRIQRFQTTEPLVTLEESIAGRKFYASAEGKAKLKEFGIKFLTGGKTIEGIQPRLGTLPADVSWATTREKMRSLAPETSNQEIVWATFFKKGKMRGMSDVEASNYAILQGNVYSQFLALRSDTPLIMRGPMGSSVFQFKRFPIKDIELGIDQVQAKNMPGVAKWLGAKLLLGGAKALVDPKLVGGGYLAYETYQALKDEYGETVANGVMYGLPGLAGVDMSYSFQLAAQPNGDNFKEALGNALLPPWASTLEAAGAAYANDKGLEDNPLQRGVNSLVEKVPSLKFINAMRAWAVSLDKGEYEFRTSDGRLKFQADLKDVLLKAGGFRTVEEGVSQLAVDGFTEIAAERNEILDRTTMKLLQVLNGEGELNEELFSETMDWNENRPEVPIAADALMTRLRRRVPADKIPEIERKLKALGKNYYYWWKATEGN